MYGSTILYSFFPGCKKIAQELAKQIKLEKAAQASLPIILIVMHSNNKKLVVFELLNSFTNLKFTLFKLWKKRFLKF